MSIAIATAVNSVKLSFDAEFAEDRLKGLPKLSKALKSNRTLRDVPVVQLFVEDIDDYREGDTVSLTRTKSHINGGESEDVFSLFDASYFPSLSVDYFGYERAYDVSPEFAEQYRSQANPVLIRSKSQGFTSPTVVALFPENHCDSVQRSSDKIFYFMDKFVERHQRRTRLLLKNIVGEGSLTRVSRASADDVQRASCHWVWLHEFFHRTGDLPLPTYMDLKSSKKSIAGLEELRVDVLGLLSCLDRPGLKEEDALLTFEFILAERLLRYSIEGIPYPNYDAVASQLLFNYLRQNGGTFVRDGKIHLSGKLVDCLRMFSKDIADIESHIYTETEEELQDRLLAFINEYNRLRRATQGLQPH